MAQAVERRSELDLASPDLFEQLLDFLFFQESTVSGACLESGRFYTNRSGVGGAHMALFGRRGDCAPRGTSLVSLTCLRRRFNMALCLGRKILP